MRGSPVQDWLRTILDSRLKKNLGASRRAVSRPLTAFSGIFRFDHPVAPYRGA